jgi:very-short-patch-repair endonuclease
MNHEFILKANKVHNKKYDYSLVNYVNTTTKVKIICPVHGEFEQIPKSHIKGSGCILCGFDAMKKKQSGNTNEFIINAKKIHGDKYDYSKVNYVNRKTNVTLICPIHGEFKQMPYTHLDKSGCKKCNADNLRFNFSDTKELFIEKSLLLGKNYDYSKVDYVNSKTKIKIICPIHGEFEQIPNSHLMGKDCKKCGSIYNKLEQELKDYLTELGVDFIENTRKVIHPFEVDIYIPSNNLAIEFDGLYWHSELYKPKDYHLDKTELALKNGVRLIHVFEDEWVHKQDIVKSRIKNILGLTDNRLYARKCTIKEIPAATAKEFLDANHIQGNVYSMVNLGLYLADELVGLMTFGGLRKAMGFSSKEGTYELVRFCNKLNTSVIGGADKLLKYFIKTYQPKEIISYADKRWSQGAVYEKLGFDFVHDSKPSYFYVNNDKREYRFKYRKNILVKEGFDANKTEHEIMLERKLYRIYDCGNKKYLLSC